MGKKGYFPKKETKAKRVRKSNYIVEGKPEAKEVILNLLRKEPFPRGQFAKHKPRADGPFKVIKRIGENAYKIELPASYEDTFNLFDSGTHRR